MSVYDRPYMKETPSGNGIPKPDSLVIWLLVVNVAAFLVQNVFTKWFQVPISHWLGLTSQGLESLMIWQLGTYGFLHGGIFHLLVNGLLIFFIGRIVENVLPPKRFLTLYFGAMVGGALFWLIWNSPSSAPLVGASAAAMGLLIFFCCLQPNRPITVFLFFVIPLTIKPKYLAIGVIAIDTMGFLFNELSGGGIAHSAHLGGAIVGFILYRLFMSTQPMFKSTGGIQVEAPDWLKKRPKTSSGNKPNYKINIRSRSEMESEVDRILDKINKDGFGSLSVEEKATLDRAKDLLRK